MGSVSIYYMILKVTCSHRDILNIIAYKIISNFSSAHGIYRHYPLLDIGHHLVVVLIHVS